MDTDSLQSVISQIHFLQLVQALLLLVIGFVLAKYVSLGVRQFAIKKFSSHNSLLLKRCIYYGILAIFVLTALQQLGFSLSILLGAAGIFTVAIGFASQLSISNLISGLFLITEKPFQVGEYIVVGDISGEVLSIDALSIKLRTIENTLARIPNETLIKANIINLSRFPTRRLNLTIGVAYKEDGELVKDTLVKAAAHNEYCLQIPAPVVNFINFGDSAINWQLSTFATQENYQALKNSLPEQIRKLFAENNIEIPYPTRSMIMSGSENLDFSKR